MKDIGYKFEDVREVICTYCWRHVMLFKEFLDWAWIKDQYFRYWQKEWMVSVTGLRKMKEAYPDMDFSKIRLVNGLRKDIK